MSESNQQQARLRIIQDSREQAPFRFEGFPVALEVGTLEAGDYSLAGFTRRIAIERKELGDLVGCLGIGRPRFERELQRLKAHDFACVVVESPVAALRQHLYASHLDEVAAWQSCLAFTQRYRIPFHFCQDRRDAEETTFHLLRHYARDRWRELQAIAPATATRHSLSAAVVRAPTRAEAMDAPKAILEPVFCHE